MTWKVDFVSSAEKEFGKLPRDIQKSINNYLVTKVSREPRMNGKPLRTVAGYKLWRYRVGSYRIVCEIDDENITVLVMRIGKRDDVYK